MALIKKILYFVFLNSLGGFVFCYVISRGVSVFLLRSVTRGGGGVQKGEKLRYVIYGQPLVCIRFRLLDHMIRRLMN